MYDYFGARYYDGRVGRWLSVDPLAEKSPGLSTYVYCRNNPIAYIDPKGEIDGYYLDTVLGRVVQFAGENDDKTNEGYLLITENDNAGMDEIFEKLKGMGAEFVQTGYIEGGIYITNHDRFYDAIMMQKIFENTGSVLGIAMLGIPSSLKGRSFSIAATRMDGYLEKVNAYERMLADLKLGRAEGKVMAGANSLRNTPLKIEPKLIEKFGGGFGEWSKMTSIESYTTSNGYNIQVHYYQKINDGMIYWPKMKVQ